MNYLGSNLVYLRSIKNLSQANVSRACKIVRSTYIGIEKGRNGQIEDLIKISNFFKLSTDLLLKVNLKPGDQLTIEQVEKGYPYKITNGKIEFI